MLIKVGNVSTCIEITSEKLRQCLIVFTTSPLLLMYLMYLLMYLDVSAISDVFHSVKVSSNFACVMVQVTLLQFLVSSLLTVIAVEHTLSCLHSICVVFCCFIVILFLFLLLIESFFFCTLFRFKHCLYR